MSKRKKTHYAVVRGRRPGIYTQWAGPGGAHEQVQGFTSARFKGFYSLRDAERWYRRFSGTKPAVRQGARRKPVDRSPEAILPIEVPDVPLEPGQAVLYTDGGCLENPGRGGYGAILLVAGNRRNELTGGFRLTTNNRMELMACIAGLEALPRRCSVTVYSDSRYVVDGIRKGWAKQWQANRWRKRNKERAENVDLWARLLDLCSRNRVEFKWVRGHKGHPGNERCDQLATEAASRPGLPPDVAYEDGQT